MLLVWNRLILPGDRSLVLEHLPGAAMPGRRMGPVVEDRPGR
ncbi:hypothetical protein [Paenirhodobacter sp.]